MSSSKNTQIFIAKLPINIRERDLEYEFRRFGTIKDLQLKTGYAFIDYEDSKEADKAIQKMDGYKFDHQRIVVQTASKKVIN